MQQSIRKARFIVQLWTDGDPVNFDSWRGTAEHIGGGQSGQFHSLDEFIEWLQQELAETDIKLES
jgi:hypothetical protein